MHYNLFPKKLHLYGFKGLVYFNANTFKEIHLIDSQYNRYHVTRHGVLKLERQTDTSVIIGEQFAYQISLIHITVYHEINIL